jgi:hypothetical protein
LRALTFSQRLAIMILRNELGSSSELRHVNISHRQFVEVGATECNNLLVYCRVARCIVSFRVVPKS